MAKSNVAQFAEELKLPVATLLEQLQAAGVIKKPLDHREVLEVGEKVTAALIDVLGRVVQEAARG